VIVLADVDVQIGGDAEGGAMFYGVFCRPNPLSIPKEELTLKPIDASDRVCQQQVLLLVHDARFDFVSSMISW
jgi:hypothetical protein